MLGRHYLNWTDRMLHQNRLLGLVVLVMLIWNVLTFVRIGQIQAQTQVVVMPVGGDDGMTVGHGRASERYLRRMSRYVVAQIGTYTAATARDQLFELLDLFPPEHAGNVQSTFERLAADIERYPSIGSTVRWSGESPLQYDLDTIQVQVRKTRLVNGAPTETQTVAYCLKYRIEETRFWLTQVSEKASTSDSPCFDDKASNAKTEGRSHA